MRVGIYQDLRDPPQWARGWSAVCGTALERVEAAERLGLDSAWCTEHHFFDDGYLPQPLTWCAAVAARTKRIRIGTAIVIAPLHAPLEIAEQAALVDQISGGRLELGLGAGYVSREFEAFGVDRERRFAITESHLVEIRRLLEEGVVSPGPVQADLPLWLGAFGAIGARKAGRNRAGMLWLDPSLLGPYREGLEQGGHDPGSGAMGGLVSMIVSNDPERAWATIKPHLDYQWRSYHEAARAGTADADMPELQEGTSIERSQGPIMLPPGYDAVTPDEAVRRLEAWLGELPVSDVFFFDSLAGMPDELVEEHMTLLATEVRPRVAALGRSAAG
jgi:alkanesulfonate monooxygenase SsuD/methylene tetrahydromethanopterin reductase-like flavin-dependent oxidoreductase (luciferase family)